MHLSHSFRVYLCIFTTRFECSFKDLLPEESLDGKIEALLSKVNSLEEQKIDAEVLAMLQKQVWKLTVVLDYYEAIETYSRIGLLRSYVNIQSYWTTTKLWKLIVVFFISLL
jgi:hypothetical protein